MLLFAIIMPLAHECIQVSKPIQNLLIRLSSAEQRKLMTWSRVWALFPSTHSGIQPQGLKDTDVGWKESAEKKQNEFGIFTTFHFTAFNFKVIKVDPMITNFSRHSPRQSTSPSHVLHEHVSGSGQHSSGFDRWDRHRKTLANLGYAWLNVFIISSPDRKRTLKWQVHISIHQYITSIIRYQLWFLTLNIALVKIHVAAEEGWT